MADAMYIIWNQNKQICPIPLVNKITLKRRYTSFVGKFNPEGNLAFSIMMGYADISIEAYLFFLRFLNILSKTESVIPIFVK